MKKSSFYTFNRVLFISVSLLLGMTFAQAQTFLGSTGDRLWSNADNWLDGLKPTEQSENVTINSDVLVDEDVAIASILDATTCSLTVQAGKRLSVSANFTWSHGGDIILEDGAQLLYHEGSLNAKILKKIAAYNEDHNLWNLIASPVMEDVTPSIENGFLTEPETGFSLYAFDEEHQDWINFKETAFVLKSEFSYLYANALDTTLIFEGPIRNVSAPAEINLSYHATTNILSGCNMVGNPFPCNAFVDRSYYILNENSNSLLPVAMSSSTPIAPCAGAIVMTKEEGQVVTLTHEAPVSSVNQGYIEISVANPDAPDKVLDQALLSFNENDELDKCIIYNDSPIVYFTVGSRELGILSIDSTDMQPVRFKALTDGNYRFHFELKDLNLNYLHLIDNITGANVDLLTTPNYSFSANHNDYTSRFQLIFDPHYDIEENDLSAGSRTFAYYAGGNIIINDVETCQGASLQIADMTGRVIKVCADVARNVSTDGMAPGVYVLRLKTQSKVLTQKVMIP